MTKDKKELEALSSLCAENNVLMVRSFLPDDIRRKRRNLKSGIQQFKGSLWVLRQIRHYIQGYKAKSKDKRQWIALEKKVQGWIDDCQERKKDMSEMLDNDFNAVKHKLNEPEKSSVDSNSLGKLSAKVVKPIPINKQTMNVVDYKKGDVFVK